MELRNKRVVIVGASSGIGLAVAQSCSAQGAHVILCSRSAEKLERARITLSGSAETSAFDMLNSSEVEQAFVGIGTLDHLLLTAVADENARRKPFRQLDMTTAQRSFDKFWGYFTVLQAAVPRMPATGSITLLSGASAFKPPKEGMAVLASANGAVATLGRALAAELAPIRVNVVSPGVVDTGVWADDQRISLATWAQESLPTRHLGQPEDIAHSIIFLMNNPYVTGIILHIDGGLNLL
jgi:NAD(P)-dependent dehydrogenase (short-subunit alcohol dehydrogenase family)